jgi:hypothetical protein
VLREMPRHRWRPGAHQRRWGLAALASAVAAAPGSWLALARARRGTGRSRFRGVAGLTLAIAAVPASWAALLTGAGIPGRDPHGPVQLSPIHATHLPYVTQVPSAGQRDPGHQQPLAPTGDASTPTPSPLEVTGSPASPAPDAGRKPKGKPSKPAPPVPTGLPTPTLPVPSCMTSKPPHVRRAP